MSAIRTYRLCLGDNLEWSIIGVRLGIKLADKLGTIMQLSACENGVAPRIVLKQWEENERVELDPEPGMCGDSTQSTSRNGWTRYYPAILRVSLHDTTRDAIFEVKETCNFRDDITENDKRQLMDLSDIRIIRQVVHTIYQQAQETGGLPCHSALIAWEGKGVLLMGYGGAGKSTCCSRIPEHWQARADDEVLVVSDGDGGYLAHPFPTWTNFLMQRGTQSWCVEEHVPLAAVFILEKAVTDDVVRIGNGQTAACISQSATQVWQSCAENYRFLSNNEKWPPRKLVFENACRIAKTVPGYILRVSLTGRFWEKIECVLSK